MKQLEKKNIVSNWVFTRETGNKTFIKTLYSNKMVHERTQLEMQEHVYEVYSKKAG